MRLNPSEPLLNTFRMDAERYSEPHSEQVLNPSEGGASEPPYTPILRQGPSGALAAPAPPGRDGLRPHQIVAIDRLRDAFRTGARRPILQAPTGFGKTRVAVEVISSALTKGRRVAFVVPLIELIGQAAAALRAAGVEVEIIGGGGSGKKSRITSDGPVVSVVSAQALNHREPPDADFVIVDEAHIRHRAVETWISGPTVRAIGLSATPFTAGLGTVFDRVVKAADLFELTAAGWLTPIRAFAPVAPDLRGLRLRAGDFEVAALADRATVISGSVVEAWKRHGDDRLSVAFAVNVAHAKALASAFRAAGIAAEAVDGSMPMAGREAILGRLRKGQTRVAVNVGVLAAGFDLPEIGCVILARPTKSEALHVQQVGRGLRPAPGKRDCLVIDAAGNLHRLGFPDDIAIDELDTGERKPPASGRKRGPIVCAECAAVRRPGRPCPECGSATARHVVEVEADLAELRPLSAKVALKRKREFFGGLLSIAERRGYAVGWARWRFHDRFDEWPNFARAKPIAPTSEVLDHVAAWRREAHRQLRGDELINQPEGLRP